MNAKQWERDATAYRYCRAVDADAGRLPSRAERQALRWSPTVATPWVRKKSVAIEPLLEYDAGYELRGAVAHLPPSASPVSTRTCLPETQPPRTDRTRGLPLPPASAAAPSTGSRFDWEGTMSRELNHVNGRLTGHALRNANLRTHSLTRAQAAPPLARAIVTLRAKVLGLTRLEFARRSGIGRSTLRDLELGLHVPARRTLQQFTDFCQGCGVAPDQLEEIYRLYAGSGAGLGPFLARLELRVGSAAELARRAGLSPATLWEYRRGNFPLPLPVLQRLCAVAGESTEQAEDLWQQTERQRFLARGYPLPLAEFWTLCARAGYVEKDLPALGLSTAALRRLRYLELPAWTEVARVARAVCQEASECKELQRLWEAEEKKQVHVLPDAFGAQLQQQRRRKGLSRRDIVDLFGVGGKKPAQLLKSVEEEGCYSARAYPAGLAALVAEDADAPAELLHLWAERRARFHRRHRPETRVDLRLARELYGFEHKDMEPILGYTPLEYQRLERGVGPLAETARMRILQAIHQAGRRRLDALLQKRDDHCQARAAWRCPPTVRALVMRLAEREGGIQPLRRHLCQAGVKGCGAAWLRAVARGLEVPPWPALERLGRACGVPELDQVRRDWREQYRARLQRHERSPLGVEVRLVVAEFATTAREFSKRLGVNPSVLIRALQRLDRGEAMEWFHVERILRAAGVAPSDRRWEQVHAWWYTTRAET
jgi:transcriptional regulator with XRE-family HTH domain